MDAHSTDGQFRSSLPCPTTTWRTTLLLTTLMLVARLAYLVWLCPYELAADEAHYWEWSRRPDLSYYSKGPGVAWLIAASTQVFGASEWAVRLPAAFASFVCALLLARLATAMSQGNQRAGLFAALVFMLIPVFYGSSQFMTIDGPYYACWVLAALAAWRIHQGSATLKRFFFLGAVIGLGMLFKYTILLLLPGLIVFFLRYRQRLPLRHLICGFGCMLGGMLLVASPIFIWNYQHGWPTIAHLIGHAGLPGGDVKPQPGWHWNPLWTVGYGLYPLVVMGPPATLLLISALRRDWRLRFETPNNWTSTAFALYTALPITLFYALVSLRTDIELNWAVAGLTVLLVPLARRLAVFLPTDPRVRAMWRWTIGFGIACAVLISFGKPMLKTLAPLRFGTWRIPVERAVHRVSGARDMARTLEALAADIKKATGDSPVIIANGYSQASLLAFYMPSHPSVRSASSVLGGRKSAYDYFDDTSLADPAILGRPAIMIGAGADQRAWERALRFERIRSTSLSGDVFVGYDYGGPM